MTQGRRNIRQKLSSKEAKRLNTKDFYFELPKERIAQTPLKERQNSRLMKLRRTDGSIKHAHFYQLEEELSDRDVLVLNDTRVIPARLFGVKESTGVSVEFLLLNRVSLDSWEVLTRPAKRLKEGTQILFGEGRLRAVIEEVLEEGKRRVRFLYQGSFEEILDELGNMPLPPYITEKLEDKERYQTVYSLHSGSSAAPTAGLHFTQELLDKLRDKGVQIEYLTLHVGLGTFRPVKAEKVEDHLMHKEYYRIEAETAERLNLAKKQGKRIICVGTTSVRTLESAVRAGRIEALSGWTDIFIYPPYQFQFVDAMITNFHLPESTLIMMISAFAGRDKVMNAYREAVEAEYRFFSFGDAMFIY